MKQTCTRLLVILTALFGAAALVGTPANALPGTPTQLTATASATEVDLGQQITVGGTLRSQRPDGSWGGVGGGLIRVRVCRTTGCDEIWGGEDAVTMGGDWSVTFRPGRTGYLVVRFDPFASERTWSLDGASAVPGRIVTWQYNSTSVFSIQRSTPTGVSIVGGTTFPNKILPPATPTLRVEFSPDGTTFTTVKTVDQEYLQAGGYWAHIGVTAPDPGYWRLSYDGSPEFAKPTSSGTYFIA
ncbi:hypothetical protein [Actinosynnema sp. NPDC020468]|uniref:hypothetical protein n=1 Tax=Actinosynnema sp. NPDC020468 TaxID=3154488 RepID=UPI0033EC0F4A